MVLKELWNCFHVVPYHHVYLERHGAHLSIKRPGYKISVRRQTCNVGAIVPQSAPNTLIHF